MFAFIKELSTPPEAFPDVLDLEVKIDEFFGLNEWQDFFSITVEEWVDFLSDKDFDEELLILVLQDIETDFIGTFHGHCVTGVLDDMRFSRIHFVALMQVTVNGSFDFGVGGEFD
jgi:hypothetical protein